MKRPPLPQMPKPLTQQDENAKRARRGETEGQDNRFGRAGGYYAGPTSSRCASSAAAQPASGPEKAVVRLLMMKMGGVTGPAVMIRRRLRIARQEVPPGKAGSATITIPIN
jgi:hypothetical protein